MRSVHGRAVLACFCIVGDQHHRRIQGIETGGFAHIDFPFAQRATGDKPSQADMLGE